MSAAARAMGWLARRPWVLVLVALVVAFLWERAETRSLRRELGELRTSQGEGFRTLGNGIAQLPAPVVVEGPTLNPFDDDDARWDAVFAEFGELRARIKETGTDPRAVAVIRAETPADSVTWRWGETVTTRRFSIYPVPEDRYRLDLHPSRIRVAVTQTKDGGWFAQLYDETADAPLEIAGFQVHEEEPGLRWEWLRWTVGAGLGADADGALGPNLWGAVTLLRLGKPGGLRWELGTLSADRYGARLGVAVGN